MAIFRRLLSRSAPTLPHWVLERSLRLGFGLSLLLSLAAHAASEGPPPTPLEALERQQQALFERIAPSVVLIGTSKGFGSGVFVRSDGLILTNAHVVAGVEQVDVVLQAGTRFPGKVLERAPDGVDLALVQVSAQGVPALSLDPTLPLAVGSWVAAVGHGRGGIWTFNTGMVSNIYPAGAERPVFQTQIPLNPGNSGGPIVNRQGELVGIVTSGIKDANSINFGIGIALARRAFKTLAADCACLTLTAPSGVPIFVDGVMRGVGPRVVLPAEAKTYDVFAVIEGKLSRIQVTWPAEKEGTLK